MHPYTEQLFNDEPEWQQLCQKFQDSSTLTTLVLTAWQMGGWFARTLVEQQLQSRANLPNSMAALLDLPCSTAQQRLCETTDTHLGRLIQQSLTTKPHASTNSGLSP
jgi:hypothetical protein